MADDSRLQAIKKRMKKAIPIFIILVFVFLIFRGFGNEPDKPEALPKIVAVQKVSEDNYSRSLDYLGIVQPDETKNYAFLLGGKVEKIYVAKGQQIKPGDILAKLETDALNISRNTAAQNVNSLENSVRLFKSNLDAIESLYENGAIAAKEYEAKQTEYLNLLNSLEIAKNSMNATDEGIRNAVIYSDMSGYVMELPFKEGEVVGAGYPVVIGKSEGIKVSIGVSTSDYPKINPSSSVLINGKIPGKIKSISAFPDENTMLYTVDIFFDTKEISIGDTVDVKVIIGEGEGYFVPMESVFNLDGIDYVFVASKDDSKNYKLNKQQVELHEIEDDMVRVTGLKTGENVVIEGVKLLKENEPVKIVDSEGADR